MWVAPRLRRTLRAGSAATIFTSRAACRSSARLPSLPRTRATSSVGWRTTGRCPCAPGWSSSSWSRPEAVRAGGGEPVRGWKAAGPAPAPTRRGRPCTRTGDGALGRKGVPGDVAGEEISRALRIVRVAHDLVAVAHGRDLEAAIEALRRRAGAATIHGSSMRPSPSRGASRAADVPDCFGRVLDAEPLPVATISRAGVEVVARAFGEFVDLKLGFLTGTPAGWPSRGERRRALGCSRADASAVRAAGFFHDLGRVAVPNGVWDKPGAVERGDWSVFASSLLHGARARALAPACTPALLAGSHHERLDGSGYHRGARAAQLSTGRACWRRPTPTTR